MVVLDHITKSSILWQLILSILMRIVLELSCASWMILLRFLYTGKVKIYQMVWMRYKADWFIIHKITILTTLLLNILFSADEAAAAISALAFASSVSYLLFSSSINFSKSSGVSAFYLWRICSKASSSKVSNSTKYSLSAFVFSSAFSLAA